MNRNRSILWALLLIGVGVILLLRNTGVVSDDVRIWPLVLMAVGVWLFLERLLFGSMWGGGFVWPLVLFAIGLVFFLEDLGVVPEEGVVVPTVVIAIGVGLMLSAISQVRGGPAEGETAAVPLEGATEASVRIDHGAGRLSVSSMIGGEHLLEGRFGGGADQDVHRDGPRMNVTLRARPRSWSPRSGGSLDWTVSLNRLVPLWLDLRTGASETNLDLTDLRVSDLAVQTGASKTIVDLPTSGRITVRVQGGAATVRVHVPTHVAARIESHGGLSTVKVDERRFPRLGSEWRSTGYDTAEHRADIRFDVGAATVEVT